MKLAWPKSTTRWFPTLGYKNGIVRWLRNGGLAKCGWKRGTQGFIHNKSSSSVSVWLKTKRFFFHSVCLKKGNKKGLRESYYKRLCKEEEWNVQIVRDGGCCRGSQQFCVKDTAEKEKKEKEEGSWGHSWRCWWAIRAPVTATATVSQELRSPRGALSQQSPKIKTERRKERHTIAHTLLQFEPPNIIYYRDLLKCLLPIANLFI